MKAYKILAAIGVAMLLCLGMMACNEVPEPQPTPDQNPVLNYSANAPVTADTIKADVAKLLNLPEGAVFEVTGRVDFTNPDKYTVTCRWEAGEQNVDVCVFANTISVTIDGKPYDGEAIHLNYNKAAASENFTNCITITDSLGNALSISKDKKSMSFADREGSYLVYYNVTDAAGQSFSVRVIYEVTYTHYISVANGIALVFENDATIAADFDGATDVWLEDANGKIDASLYEIKENSILLKKEYYESFLGKRVAIKACSEHGGSYFYVSVYDRDSYSEYLKHQLEGIISYQSSYATFEFVENGPAGIDFEYAYRYTKSAGPTVDQTALVFHTLGKYGTLSFDLFVNSSYNAAGNMDMELQLARGAKFASVENSIFEEAVKPSSKNE